MPVRSVCVFCGASTGVNPAYREAAIALGQAIAERGLTRLEVVDGMHARKARMAELSDAFVALPGGLGTLEELFEVWTWGQLGYHAKPLGLLDVNGFYSKLGSFLDHVVEEGFVRPQHRAMLQLADSPAELLDAMDSFEAPVLPKWVDKKPD